MCVPRGVLSSNGVILCRFHHLLELAKLWAVFIFELGCGFPQSGVIPLYGVLFVQMSDSRNRNESSAWIEQSFESAKGYKCAHSQCLSVTCPTSTTLPLPHYMKTHGQGFWTYSNFCPTHRHVARCKPHYHSRVIAGRDVHLLFQLARGQHCQIHLVDNVLHKPCGKSPGYRVIDGRPQ